MFFFSRKEGSSRLLEVHLLVRSLALQPAQQPLSLLLLSHPSNRQASPAREQGKGPYLPPSPHKPLFSWLLLPPIVCKISPLKSCQGEPSTSPPNLPSPPNQASGSLFSPPLPFPTAFQSSGLRSQKQRPATQRKDSPRAQKPLSLPTRTHRMRPVE